MTEQQGITLTPAEARIALGGVRELLGLPSGLAMHRADYVEAQELALRLMVASKATE